MQADLHSDHTTVTYGRFNAGELADSLTETESSTLFMLAALVTSHTDVLILHSYVCFY